MGIKFLCPNGHKLNVKSFLSGKKAICPKCGVKVLVPNESILADAAAAQVNTAEAGAAPTFPSDDVGHLGSVDVPASTLQSPTGGMGQVAVEAPQSSVSPGIGAAAAVFSAVTAPSPVRDAIDEAPAAVWYVRPPSGGQFGPAAADMMRTWLADGRVTATSLVWRSGWPQWLSAQTAFPQLAGSLLAAPLPQGAASGMYVPGAYPAAQGYPQSPAMTSVTGPMMGAPYGGAAVPLGQVPVGQVAATAPYSGFDVAGEGAITRRPRRRKSSDATAIVSGILIVLTLVLVIILVMVLTRNTDPPAVDGGPAKTENRAKKAATPPAPVKPKSTEEEI